MRTPLARESPESIDGRQRYVHLHVRDVARGRAFYSALFGVEPVKARADHVKFLPAFAPLNLALSPDPNVAGARGSVSHLGIQLASTADVRQHLARVKAAGLAVREEFDVDCCHANQDKFWVTDPDGNEWEIYHLKRDLADDAPAAKANALSILDTPCCGQPGQG